MECFNTELRKVVALRFLPPDDSDLDAVDGERAAYRYQREREQATYAAWSAEHKRRQQALAEERRWCDEQDRLEEAQRTKERIARDEALRRQRQEEEARKQAVALETMLAETGRPRITAANAVEWPPPCPYERRCKGDECACKQYQFFNPCFIDAYKKQLRYDPLKWTKRIKKKNPFKCEGTRNDPFVRYSPCDGEYVHFTWSEPVKSPWATGDEMVRFFVPRSDGEIERWYAQLTGEWLSYSPTTSGVLEFDVNYAKAFRQWRRLMLEGAEEAARKQAEEAAAAAAPPEEDDHDGDSCEPLKPVSEWDEVDCGWDPW